MKARGRMVSIPEPVAAYLLNALRFELDANQDPPSDEYNLMGVAANALANGLQKLKGEEAEEADHAEELQASARVERCPKMDRGGPHLDSPSMERQCLLDEGHGTPIHDFGPWRPIHPSGVPVVLKDGDLVFPRERK